MPRILYFSHSYTPHDHRFMRTIAEHAYETYFLQLEQNGPWADRPLPAGVRRVAWEGPRQPLRGPEEWFSLMPALERVVEGLRPDLIHAGPVTSCGFLASLLDRYPLLLMSWASDVLIDADRDALWRWLSCYALSHADRLLCDSPVVREKVRQLVGYPDERVVELPWGVDLQAFRPGRGGDGLRRRLGWEDARVVLSTRGWDAIHGIETLLEAFTLAAQTEPRLRLLLLGAGSDSERVLRLLGQGRFNELIYVAGHVMSEDIVPYFQAADVYLSCARSDGTSVSLLEALAIGLPVVVTDQPSNRTWVQPEMNGWFGKTGDANSFAAMLLKAVQLSPSERRAIQQRNRQVVEERADWNRNVERLFAAYASLIGSRA